MIEKTLRVENEVGLHARPAAKFVKLATTFPANIQVKNATTGSAFVNAKSILGVLTLGVNQGHEIHIQVEGDRAEEALEALVALVTTNFGG